MIEQEKFTYSPLGKAFVKQKKITEDQREKQMKEFKIKGKLRQLKNVLVMMKIVHQFQNKKKFLINL